MYFKQIPIGGYDKNFCYFLGDSTEEVVVVDPVEIDRLSLIATEEEGIGRISAILITHSHFDHIGGTPELFEKIGPIPVYIHENGADKLSDIPEENLFTTRDGDVISKAGLETKVHHTPGHISDAVCYEVDGHLITGDTLFVGGCGRCDFAGSDVEAMYDTLYEKLAMLPRNLKVYPGHDYGETSSSTLEHEYLTNPYLLAKSKDKFVKFRLNG